jgi:phytoene/squalene synthetase
MSSPSSELSLQVRRLDRDRFATALFAPVDARDALLALYAFNAEVARVRENVREAMAGMIRLQWWREALAGERPGETERHPVAAPLIAACRAAKVSGEAFERLLDARERDLSSEVPQGLDEVAAYAADTAGALAQLALELLGARDPETIAAGQAVGTAFGLAGLLRAVPFHLAQGRLMIPEPCLREAGISSDDVFAGSAPRQAVAGAARLLGLRALALLAEARRRKVDKLGMPVLLQGVQAGVYLRALERGGWDVLDARNARPRPMPVRLMWAAATGRF